MAGKVIEEALLVLKASTEDFKKEMSAAAKATQDSAKEMASATGGMNDTVKGAIESFTKFKGAIVAAAGIGGLAALVKSTFDAADELGALAQQTGVSTKFLQEMRYAASQLNVDQSTLTTSLGVFTKKIGEAALGGEEGGKAFRVLGLSVTDAAGKTKTAETLFGEVADKMSKIESEAERAALAQDLFGKSGLSMVNILSQGREGLSELSKKANELGLVISDRLIKGADETNDKMATLAMVLKSQVSTALLELAPAIQKTVELMLRMARTTNDIAQGWGILIRRITGDKTAEDKIQDITERIVRLQQKIKEEQTPWALDVAKRYGTVGVKIGQYRAEIEKLTEEMFRLQNAEQKGNEVKRSGAAVTESLLGAEKKRIELAKEAQKIADATSGKDKTAAIEKEIAVLESAQKQKLKIQGDYDAILALKREELASVQEQERAKEIDGLVEQLALMRELKDANNAEDIARGEARLAALMAQEDEHSNHYLKTQKKISDDKKKADALDKKLNEEKARDQQATLDWISQLQYSKSKEMAAVGKAAAIVSTTISTYEAAQKAFSAMAGIPFVGPILGGIAAAAAIAAGMSRVAAISGINIGFRTGADRVPGVGAGDSVPAMLQPGERVVKTDTNRVLEQFLRDYRDGMGYGGGAERVQVELVMRDDLMDWIETKLVERGRVSVSVRAA